MTLRLVFEPEDLQRVRLATGPDPLWELVSSVHIIRLRNPPACYAEWLVDARHRLARHDSFRSGLSLLAGLVPPRGNFPDFLTPAAVTVDLDSGCEAILRTPRARLAADVEAVYRRGTAPGWATLLAAGDRQLMRTIVTVIRQAHDVLVAPEWQRIRHTVLGDRSARAELVATAGVERLLATLPGALNWDGTTLTVSYPCDHTVALRGRGLTLVPSYFTTGTPVTLIDPELPPVLVFPVREIRTTPPELSPALGRLMTRTRAECLHILLTPHSTTALAHRLGVSVGTACKQTMVLRECGLILSSRDGAAVVHQATSLGLALLTATDTHRSLAAHP